MTTILADHRQVDVWKAARVGRIGASDAASYARLESVNKYVAAKLMPMWDGSEFSSWGNQREPIILADWGYEQNHMMFASDVNPRFVCTPDGIGTRLCQVKTTNKDFRSKRTNEILVPANYRRQVWWEQMVMGPEYTETDFIFEHYERVNGILVPDYESTRVVIERDEGEIAKMIQIAELVLHQLDLSTF